ncbi:potassium transporter Kup [Oligoflexus tunisiensis]|uniref:potassium transporter Kup n=1 Tax=Oligoflexus tunisiensis TaxID=708132 RepID=UPI00114CAEBD
MLNLTLGALGVVFGDIGTSPLYALRECFHHGSGLPVTPGNVLGLLSLVFWALIIVISLKYVLYVMRADNRGEGGVLALMALAHPKPKLEGRDPKKFLIFLGLFGAALLYGDGVITPAISVLSAVEGLEISTPLFKPYVVPIAVLILCLLFLPQKYGTDKIGKAFGPIILIWFITIGALGIGGIRHNPSVLQAVNPLHAVRFFLANGWHGFLALGAVFLVATGGEALYADIGHFGRKPINIAWFFLVLPSLALNYFGQGALLLESPEAYHHPFYFLAPNWATMPLVFLSTMAAIIASQALISGAYSITHQAIQLGYLPRQKIRHTSHHEIGQIYVPLINWAMLLGTVALVLIFQRSGRLAAAYGLAVTATMVITTILIYYVARDLWKWRPWIALLVSAVLLTVDLSFFFANLVKLLDGGFIPLVIGLVIFTSMVTWRRGRYILGQRLKLKSLPVDRFIEQLETEKPYRVGGTGLFMTSVPDSTPPSLVHNVRHNHVMHEHTILLTVVTESIPYVAEEEQIEIKLIHPGIYSARIRYGFMEMPDVPACLERSVGKLFPYDAKAVTYFLGRESLVSTRRPGMARWREHLFSFMTRNSQKATDFFKLPADQVFEIGIVVEL